MPEYPGRSFSAVVKAALLAIDVASGTTRMQLAVDNTGGEVSRMYVWNFWMMVPRCTSSVLIFDEAACARRHRRRGGKWQQKTYIYRKKEAPLWRSNS